MFAEENPALRPPPLEPFSSTSSILEMYSSLSSATVAVGMSVARRSRTDPHEGHYRMRLLSCMNGVKDGVTQHTISIVNEVAANCWSLAE